MGRNSAIKQFNARPEGQPMELVDSLHGRTPAIHELLQSPWLVRASELLKRDETFSTKRLEQPLDVTWDPERERPAAFVRNGRTWRVDAVVQTWSVERSWWERRKRVSRQMWRVIARGGVYDLAFDRLENAWFLLGVQD
jgi:hypothetical protein